MSQSGLDLILDEEKVERMVTVLANSHVQAGDLKKAILDIANTIDDDVLVGKSGDTFSAAMRQSANTSVAALETYLKDLENDFRRAIELWHEAVEVNKKLTGR